jgi:ABC-type dipeptide/oligopeptide/nickel transport system ATPase component
MIDLKNLTIFQQRILNMYLIPILVFSFVLSIFLTYNINKYLRNDFIRYKNVKVIKYIKRKNIEINEKYLKNWTTLTENQKNIIVNDKSLNLENDERFKLTYNTIKEEVLLNSENINEYYNFLIFLKVLFSKTYMLILFFSIPLISLFFFYKKYYLIKLKQYEKFINLHFFLQELTTDFKSQSKDKNIKLQDKFLTYDFKNQYYIYKTNKINQYDNYKKFKNDIGNFLGFENVKIKKLEDGLKIRIYESKVPNSLNFDNSKILENKIFLGCGENKKDIYLNIDTFKHSILIGESGSGKSVNVQHILLSFFKNLHNIEKIFLVDFKLVEMSRYTNTHEKIEVVGGLDRFITVVEELEKLMFDRYEEMKKMDLTNYFGYPIFVFIDEFRTIKNNSLKKEENERVEKILINLLQKSRRSKIFFIFRGQKRDTQNISSSILSNIMNKIRMKTTNTDNLIKIRGTQEELELLELSHSEIRNFNKGKMLFSDGESGESFLIQRPFFNVNDEKQSFFMYKLLGFKDEEIKRKIERMKFINELREKFKNNLINKKDINKLINEYDEKKLIVEEIETVEEIKEIENIQIIKRIETVEDLEIIRLKKWEEIKLIENKEELKEKRLILMNVKKLIKINQFKDRESLLKDF